MSCIILKRHGLEDKAMSGSNGNGKPSDENNPLEGFRIGTLKKEWAKPFLDGLREHANVAEACRLAEITQSLVYHDRKEDEEFATAWNDALDVGIAKLEIACRKRALHGVRNDEEIKYSDTLAIFLLKAHRPEVYRERSDVNVKLDGVMEYRAAGQSPEQGLNELDGELEALGRKLPQWMTSPRS